MPINSFLKKKRDDAKGAGGSGTGDSKRKPGSRGIAGGGSLVAARKLALKGQWGQVFGPLNLNIDKGGLTVLTAPPGAARTALMMTLCGRMNFTSGTLRVLDHTNDLPAIFDESGICCFDELDGYQPSVTVQDLITEQIRWESHWYEWVPQATTEELKKMCGYLFEDIPLPPIDAFIADLPEIDQMLLRIGVANTRRPPLLVVGRLDHMADDEQRHQLIVRLIELGKKQSVITADVNGDEFEDHDCTVVDVPGLLEFQQRSTAARELAEQETRVDDEPDEDDRGEEEPDDWDEADDGADEKPINGRSEEPEDEK